MNSGDVKYSIERAIRNREGPSGDLPPIEGVAEFLSGASGEIPGIEAVAPSEVRFHLTRPDPMFLHFLALPECYVVPREAIEGDAIDRHPVGTGPFRLASCEPSTGIQLLRNRQYWGRDEEGERLPYIDALFFKWLPTTDGHQLLVEGAIDAYTEFSGLSGAIGEGRDGKGEQGVREITRPLWNTIFARFGFDPSCPLGRNRELRAAVVAACAGTIDSLSGHLRPAKGLFPRDSLVSRRSSRARNGTRPV